MIQLSDGTTTLTLHPDLYWSDENDWHPVEQTVQRTLTGALIVSTTQRVAGRPITLEPEDEESAWQTLEVLAQLRNWAAVPGQELTLTLRGVDRTVIFRHQDGTAVEAAPVLHRSDVQDDDFYRITVRLMET